MFADSTTNTALCRCSLLFVFLSSSVQIPPDGCPEIHMHHMHPYECVRVFYTCLCFGVFLLTSNFFISQTIISQLFPSGYQANEQSEITHPTTHSHSHNMPCTLTQFYRTTRTHCTNTFAITGHHTKHIHDIAYA